MNSQPVARGSYSQWLPGALLALACGTLYLAVRPPLFAFDGYMYRVYALRPDWFYNANPHHLLWNFIQALIGTVAAAVGHPTTIPFQMVGIALNCATLFFLFALLRKSSGNSFFTTAGVLLVAFSPGFWFLGFQNEPYPLLFLVMVLYLRAWHTQDGGAPTGWRALAAGLCLVAATFLQQAAVLLVPAGMLGLAIFGRGKPARRLMHALLWGVSVAAIVLPLYLFMWATTATGGWSFFQWITEYLKVQHSIQFQLPASLIKAVVGISGSLIQSNRIQSFLDDNLQRTTILALYGGIGALSVLGIAAITWWIGLGHNVWRLVRTNALFTTSLLAMVAWSAFVIAWEPVTSYYWVLNFFPGLLCLGLLFRDQAGRGLRAFAIVVLFLVAWNCYFNREFDRDCSRDFPEPLLATIQQHIGPRDIFIVLERSGDLRSVDYDLLIASLQYGPRNPAVAILDDLVPPAGNRQIWRDKLRKRIDATFDSGGHAFVASHVFDPQVYRDLFGSEDPFSPWTDERYREWPSYEEVQEAFAPYKIKVSDFRLGKDEYFLLQRR